MNDDSPFSETELDSLLEEYFDRRDCGESVDREVFSSLPAELVAEFYELTAFAEYFEEAVRVEKDPEEAHQERYDPLADTAIYSDADHPTGLAANPESNALHQVGDYQLSQELGRGGMGIVFKAHQTKLNRTVALKMILSGRMASKNELERFYSEARSVARLCHPNIVSIYDVQEVDGHHFYSMDYIEGSTLESVAKSGNLTEQQIAKFVNLIAQAVEYAHQNGILHRDLKPANVLVDSEDQPHVTDFGLAKQLEDESGLTQSGTILGTPSFMSPEQAAGRNEEVGPTSDVYALGAILYFLLTSKPPFHGKTGAETITKVIHDQPRPLRSFNSRLSRSLVTICEKCMQKDPKQRYQSAQELAVELERFLRGDPIQAQPINRFKRSWIWCRDIPLVAALIGRTPSTNNRGQTRLQWSILSLFACFGLFVAYNAIRATMLPDVIQIVSGDKKGMYHHVAQRLSNVLQETTEHPVVVRETKGSIENRDLLVSGNGHLGFLQASAMDIQQVAVVAPLYREFCFVIVPKNFPMDAQPPDLSVLTGKTIVVGPEGSGNRVSAIKILRFFGVTDQNASFSAAPLRQLQDNASLHAAIVVTGVRNQDLVELLETGKFRLLPIPLREEIFQGTGFYFALLKPGDLRFGLDLKEEIHTVATPALLVVRKDEHDVVVEAACQALMHDQWLETLPGALSPGTFDYLTRSLPLHPAAAKFFKSQRQSQLPLSH